MFRLRYVSSKLSPHSVDLYINQRLRLSVNRNGCGFSAIEFGPQLGVGGAHTDVTPVTAKWHENLATDEVQRLVAGLGGQEDNLEKVRQLLGKLGNKGTATFN